MAKKKQPLQTLPSLFDASIDTIATSVKTERRVSSPESKSFDRTVNAEFNSSMIGYSKFVAQLPDDLKNSFLPYIKNVTGSIRFPIEEDSVINGNKYLQEIFDDLLKQHGYNQSL